MPWSPRGKLQAFGQRILMAILPTESHESPSPFDSSTRPERQASTPPSRQSGTGLLYGKNKRRVAFLPPAFAMFTSLRLELLRQADVVVAITDGIERRVVVVVERSEHRWRLPIEDVVHANGQPGAPQHPLPDRSRGGLGLHHVLAVLRFFDVRSGLISRLHELVGQLHVERDVAGHAAMQDEARVCGVNRVGSARILSLDDPGRIAGIAERSDEVRIVLEVADVVEGRDEVEVSPIPFPTEEGLVEWNRTGREREGGAEVTEEVMVTRRRVSLRLPGEEVVPTTREGELAPTFRRDLVNRCDIQALDEALTGVAEVSVDCFQSSVIETGDTVRGTTRTIDGSGTVTEAVRIELAR